jgi:hypothetical protein
MAVRCKSGETQEQARARHALKMREWRKKNAEHHREWRREYTKKNRAQLSEYERQRSNRRWKESPEYQEASLTRIRAWQQKVGKEYLRQQGRDRTRQIKLEIIEAYGGKCVCCGEDNFEFLTIHHIDGSGAAHRKELRGNSFYRWLKKRCFPKDNFELNCWNCNVSKDMYGFCPHQVQSAAWDTSTNFPDGQQNVLLKPDMVKAAH